MFNVHVVSRNSAGVASQKLRARNISKRIRIAKVLMEYSNQISSLDR
jgi:hypothetical protein